jgi:SAM-dependent methyltransferase
MGQYAQAAEFYDILYLKQKDYQAEAEHLAGLIRDLHPAARRVLDVGCGTGEHARLLTALGFEVDGVDLEPTFVELARAKCPAGAFVVADMTALALAGRYDVVVCLFSAIGYVGTVEALRRTVAGLAAHLSPAGVLMVDPWFEPGQLTDRWLTVITGEAEGLKVCRMSRTLVDDRVSRLEFEYLIGRPDGIERRSETHELGLFTQEEMETAFRKAGLTVTRQPEALRTRGLYVGGRGA